MAEPGMIDLWQGNWGDFEIPDDVPIATMRKDGWFDKRYQVTPSLQLYFSCMDEHVRDGKPIMTWAEWTKARG